MFFNFKSNNQSKAGIYFLPLEILRLCIFLLALLYSLKKKSNQIYTLGFRK